MGDAYIGHGTLLQRGDGGGPEVFTTVAEVLNISGPSISRDAVDVTTMDSPDQYREFIGGLLDGGEVTFDVVYDPVDPTIEPVAGLLSELALVSGSAATNWQLVFSDPAATTWAFPAIVTGVEPAEAIDDKVMLSVTLKVSGKVTLA